ncbi:hypothetical protein [Streptomyces flaveolus]|uniref:hypothetical protein n=1 Tax=Streptomyces flaveolus TaxID=67297 RepID=UPI001670818A|nr:hypothetical protein [Streptomyces flaveolus]GGQ43994.1 hypothetical protein GCM10010216_00010 [Streptomyces flaveolus]
MDLEKRPPGSDPQEPARRSDAEGCLTVAIRIPVRIVVLVLVVPVRLVWDALVVGGRFLRDTVLRPFGRALGRLGRALFVWPAVGLWRYVVVPLARGIAWLGRILLVVPAVWLYRWVLTPVGHGFLWVGRGVGAVLAAVGRGLYAVGAWLGRYLVVVPATWLYTWVLTPVGHAIAWCGRGIAWCLRTVVTGVGTALYWTARILLVLPVLALWRWVLAPVGRGLAVVGREVGAALGHAWRIAGHVSLAVGRFLGTVFRLLVGDPARWVYRTLLTPVGHVVRDAVWRPAADASRAVGRAVRQALEDVRGSVRRARADVLRALFGEPATKPTVARREPSAAEARTLGSSTTALTKD